MDITTTGEISDYSEYFLTDNCKDRIGSQELLSEFNYLQISDNGFYSNNISEANFVWGQPLRITSSELERDEYIVSLGPDGIFHSIWIQDLTTEGIALGYSHSIDNVGMNWVNPSHVLRLDSSISHPNMIVDSEGTIHIAFISTMGDYSRIYYLNKHTDNASWNKEESLFTSTLYKFSSLSITITNNKTVNIAWISSEIDTSEIESSSDYWDSLIYFTSRDGVTGQWFQEPVEMYNSSNPLLVQVSTSVNGTLQMCWTVRGENPITNKVMFTEFDEENRSWLNPTEIAETNLKVGDLAISQSRRHGGSHFLWREDAHTYRISHRERFTNGTFSGPPTLLSYLISDSYLGGIIDDQETGNLYCLFEDDSGVASDLFLRKRLNGEKSWEPRERITNDGYSIDPIYLPSYSDEKTIGQLFYLNYQSIVSRNFNASEHCSELSTIFKTAHHNSYPSFTIDSEGILHVVWKHIGTPLTEIFYQKKLLNQTWGSIERLSTDWNSATTPKIIADSEDNLHCLFVAKDNETNKDGVFYRSKIKGEDYWREPRLIHSPEGNALDLQPEIIIDENDTLYVFWIEEGDGDYNKMFYTERPLLSENFTAPILLTLDNHTYSYFPNVLIDSSATIHLTHIEFDVQLGIIKLQYRYKDLKTGWSNPMTLSTSTSDVLYQPMITLDSEGMLRLIYMRRHRIGSQLLLADSVLYEKSLGETDWSYKETFIIDEPLDNHFVFMLPNDTLCYVYHTKYFGTRGRSNGGVSDRVFLRQLHPEGVWGETQLLFLNPFLGTQPLGAHDPLTDNIYFIIQDKRGTYPHLNWLMSQKDSDQDLLGDFDESIYNTNPFTQDSDNDMLFDGMEVGMNFTNPALNDTDWDNLTDGEEVLIYQTNPFISDSDEDKLSDGNEVLIWNTDPNSKDSDGDGLSDFDEIYLFGTNPINEDTDSDGMPDAWELHYGLDPRIGNSSNDEDEDNLGNLEEYQYGTDPSNPDCDGDTLLDGDEVKIWQSNPLDFDSDDDTISDSDEVLIFNTNPLSDDSDNDGFKDREEIHSGTDPNNPRDNVRTKWLQKILLSTLIPIIAIITIIVFIEIFYRINAKRIEELEREEIEKEEEELEKLISERI